MPLTFRPLGKLRRDGARLLGQGIKAAVQRIWADEAYGGRLVEWVRDHLEALLEVVPRPSQQKGFQVLPCRWVVERTLGAPWGGSTATAG